ncbi:MAG: 50S ribosome-binding GTPase [Actinomycetota bacterium]|nr:50S ribosome-binding GTPase [Actinomycetota bacterium]MDQ6934302.1 50S ribosome-binding GTPase [Actinomycetota bacterium]
MTSLVQGALRLAGKRGELGGRIDGLTEAVEATRGRLDDELVESAAAVLSRAQSRLRLSPDHTVVALAGATGSGKSSTFNALTGLDLARVGVRRPTTSHATACVWGDEGAGELLEWLGIPTRHQVVHDSVLDAGRDVGRDKSQHQLDGLVLLDLPDHDSVEVAHYLEVERFVGLADLLVWILDPQKYADLAIHRRFLQPLAAHGEVMLVVLNQIDVLSAVQRPGVLADVRRLLDVDGLAGVPVVATSARTGEGLAQLRTEIARRVADKAAARTRLGADISAAAARLSEVNGDAKPHRLGDRERIELNDAVADAAGVPLVVSAVRKSTALRAQQATGWPVTAWLSKLRPDPLRRLHLDRGSREADLVNRARSSLPAASHVQQARVESALRAVGDEASNGLSRPWASAVRRAATGHSADLTDELDRAVSGTDLGMRGTPAWCRGVRALQWVLLVVAAAGALWLGTLAVMGYLRVPQPGTPTYHGFPVPTLLLVAGVALGVLLALLARVLIRIGSQARARKADRRLRAGVTSVTDKLVVKPIEAELTAYGRARDGLHRARG